ncbi:MAG TPA: T6SS immunity protein Tdi1 domain-containing protein [Ramlibacter sp.]|nr:T6SS immunity protein Tdi1 domain-containing protein [Ramlibacter sp.]
MPTATELLDEIAESWGWTGLQPSAVVAENAFGNLLVEDKSGRFWRMCPEDVYCERVAWDREALQALFGDQDFLEDWEMFALVESAVAKLGANAPGEKYCLLTPGALGGAYSVDNIGRAPLVELVRFSGGLGRYLRDLPDGAPVRFRVVD